jgi:hypothetical protein
VTYRHTYRVALPRDAVIVRPLRPFARLTTMPVHPFSSSSSSSSRAPERKAAPYVPIPSPSPSIEFLVSSVFPPSRCVYNAHEFSCSWRLLLPSFQQLSRPLLPGLLALLRMRQSHSAPPRTAPPPSAGGWHRGQAPVAPGLGGTPLRNRTVDLLLTMNDRTDSPPGQTRPDQGKPWLTQALNGYTSLSPAPFCLPICPPK